MRTDRGRSAAQWFCLIIGGTLVLAGLLGFMAEPTFDTSTAGDPGALDGEKLVLFEVNGWHNVVHVASGLFLLGLAGRRRTARTAALAFGAVYVVVTVVGLVDGHDVLELIPVNPADNVLHILLTATALAVALISEDERGDMRARGRDRRFARESTASSPTLNRR